jgi:hypothetical protein
MRLTFQYNTYQLADSLYFPFLCYHHHVQVLQKLMSLRVEEAEQEQRELQQQQSSLNTTKVSILTVCVSVLVCMFGLYDAWLTVH